MGRHLFRQLLAIILLALFGPLAALGAVGLGNGELYASPADSPASERLDSAQALAGPAVFSPGFELNELVRNQLSFFRSPSGLRWLEDGMRRGAPYRDFIMASLAARGMPPELYFLAMIESTFDVRAISSSGAAGLWQFMLNSVGNWMDHDEWVDERFDFWSSTRGAIAKLADNYREFRDWPLALAAYNAGMGRIRQLMKKTGAKTYWELQRSGELSAETRIYVPRMLAAMAIASQAARHGLPISWNRPVEWSKIRLKGQISVSRLENAAQLTPGMLRQGNAELRGDLTPPVAGHELKVPNRYLAQVADALLGLDTGLTPLTHVIAKGETLYTLGKRYGVSSDQILAHNPGLRPERLRIGQKLLIPLLPPPKLSDGKTKEALS